MSQFLYLYRMTEAARQDNMGTPERAQQSMQRWMAWMNDLDAKGHLKDRGQPLERTGKVVRGQQRTVTDGPFTEAKDLAISIRPWNCHAAVRSSREVAPWRCGRS